jgi:hypothetical protein
MKQKIDIVKPLLRLDENLITKRKQSQALNEIFITPKSAAPNMDLISMLDTPQKYSR